MVLLPKGINSFGLPIRFDSPAARTTAEIMQDNSHSVIIQPAIDYH
jgi:hypothetical protein